MANVQALLNKNAASVIAELENQFDSHEFIKGLMKEDEKGYVEELYSFRDVKSGIFRSFHAQIGMYLNSNATRLRIMPMQQVSSTNIKGYESVNEEWQKVIPDAVQNDGKGN